MKLDSASFRASGIPVLGSQSNWAKLYCLKKKRQAAMPDIYRATQENDEFLEELRKDFQARLMTSTKINYDTSNLEARISHYSVNPDSDGGTASGIISIPIYHNNYLRTVLQKGKCWYEGMGFLQKLFDTDDSGKELMHNLERISGVKETHILVTTPPLKKGGRDWWKKKMRDPRNQHPNRVCAVRLNYGVFIIECDILEYGNEIGCSRGLSE